VLARAHRIVDGDHLRQVFRRGSRVASEYFVAARLTTQSEAPGRFGFVVSKQVGGAVVRNRVKRRLREMAQGEITRGFSGEDVVVRALPAASAASYEELASAWGRVFPR
jgi:ribonuclease P protein component